MTRRLLLLLGLFGSLSFAGDMKNYTGSVTKQILFLVSSGEPVFLSFGFTTLTTIGITMTVVYGLKWAAASASRHHAEFDFPAAIHFFALFLIAEFMLLYYTKPMFGSGSSFSQMLPDTGMYFAKAISKSGFDTLIQQITDIVKSLQGQSPSIWAPEQLVVWIWVIADMLLIEGALFALTILGFVALGIGALLGPIFIPFLPVPRLSWLFWNWLSFMLKYSFYQVVAAALVFVWTNVLVTFISGAMQGNYTIANWLEMIVPLGLLNIGMFVSMFKISSFVNDLFGGGATAGALLGGNLLSSIRGMFS